MARVRRSGAWRVAVCLAVAAMIAASCGPASPIAELDATLSGNLVLLPVRVNGSAPLTFILDTGASGLVIDARRLGDLGLTARPSADAETGGGSVPAGEVTGVQVSAGAAELRDVTLSSIDLSPLESGIGRRIDGILGFQFFDRYVVEIDYRGGRVRVYEPSRATPRDDAAEVPLVLEEGLPFANVEVAGSRGTPAVARVEVDTGLTGSLSLTRKFVESGRLVQPSEQRLRITSGALLPGQVSSEVVRIARVRLGPFDLEQIVTTVPSSAEAAGVSGDTVGLLGGDLLRRFTVTFDYSRARMLLEPNGALDEHDEFDMSGMSLAAQPDGTCRVRMVIEYSPAFEAGIQAGDVLVAVDGQDEPATRLDDIRLLLQQAGRMVPLRVSRGGEVREVAITLRRLI